MTLQTVVWERSMKRGLGIGDPIINYYEERLGVG